MGLALPFSWKHVQPKGMLYGQHVGTLAPKWAVAAPRRLALNAPRVEKKTKPWRRRSADGNTHMSITLQHGHKHKCHHDNELHNFLL